MALLPLLTIPNPQLREISRAVKDPTADHAQLILDMILSMRHYRGIGLAAPQIGVLERVFVMQISSKAPLFHFINPEILDQSEDIVNGQEGCLSVPDQFGYVPRPQTVRVRYQGFTDLSQGKGREYKAEWKEKEFCGLEAVCVQHEIDHLNGVLFTDHLDEPAPSV